MPPAEPAAGAGAPWRLKRVTRSDRKLLQSSTPTLISRTLARCGQFIFLLAAARMLNVDEFAVYSYIVGLYATFSMLADPVLSFGQVFWLTSPARAGALPRRREP